MANYKHNIINVLKDLMKMYPNQLFSTHFALALADYPDYDGLSDKELYHAFNKYKCEKELDMDIPHSNSIDSIIQAGLDLDTILDEEEEF